MMELADAIKFTLEGEVWKLHPDPYSNWLVVEVRNTEKQEATFTAFYEGELKWRGLQLEEVWWVNSVGVFNGKLLIHQYDDSPFPSPAFLICIDVNTQEIVFDLDNQTFQDADQHILHTVPSKPEFGNKSSFYSLENGSQVEEKIIEPLNTSSIQTPLIYLEEDKGFSSILSFFKKKGIDVPTLQIEYLELDKLFIISTYHQQKEKHTQRLYIFDVEGNLLRTHVLQDEIDGKSPQSFILHNNRLWFFEKGGDLILQKI